MTFSTRAPADLRPNRLSRALAAARTDARSLVDLTITNPTRVHLDYPRNLLHALATPDALVYDPQPLGHAIAREAVRGDYARRGLDVAAKRVVLTASTSEAYSILFKLLCDAGGDAVLVPTPSYPLFDHLTRLDGVAARAYRLEYHGGWTLDIDALEAAWSPHVRALLVVSPNNPTGSVLSRRELEEVQRFCVRRALALIVDEVFADYPLQERPPHPPQTEPVEALTFRLGGLSKSAGLPQVKLGWVAVDGPPAVVGAALERLEFICDTYLSVSTPAQLATPALIEHGATVRAGILSRVRQNYRALRDMAAAHPSVEVLPAEAGWSAVIRVPGTRTEEDLAIELLERDRVLVHPGYFFDFPHEAFVVVSLLPAPATFADGVGLLLERIDA